MSPLVTLTTDVGEVYAAQMKAVLYRRLPAGTVVDLSHSLPAHGVEEGAFLLLHMARRFPRGTIHVAVVDPGVGGERAPLGIATGEGSFLVGPDNGLLWPLASDLGSPHAVRLDPARIAESGSVAPTFAGRDLFAPAASLLASGTSLEFLGSPVEPRRYDIPAAQIGPGLAEGLVLHIDRFGNIITNVPTPEAPPVGSRVAFRIGNGPSRRTARQQTYEELAPGGFGVLGSSFGYLEISRRERPAALSLRARVGDRVRLTWPK